MLFAACNCIPCGFSVQPLGLAISDTSATVSAKNLSPVFRSTTKKGRTDVSPVQSVSETVGQSVFFLSVFSRSSARLLAGVYPAAMSDAVSTNTRKRSAVRSISFLRRICIAGGTPIQEVDFSIITSTFHLYANASLCFCSAIRVFLMPQCARIVH